MLDPTHIFLMLEHSRVQLGTYACTSAGWASAVGGRHILGMLFWHWDSWQFLNHTSKRGWVTKIYPTKLKPSVSLSQLQLNFSNANTVRQKETCRKEVTAGQKLQLKYLLSQVSQMPLTWKGAVELKRAWLASWFICPQAGSCDHTAKWCWGLQRARCQSQPPTLRACVGLNVHGIYSFIQNGHWHANMNICETKITIFSKAQRTQKSLRLLPVSLEVPQINGNLWNNHLHCQVRLKKANEVLVWK